MHVPLIDRRRLSPQAMLQAGWTRVDPQRRKGSARWVHVKGWRLEHCGHPTALTPWALFNPAGEMVCTGARQGNPAFGTAWPNLATAVAFVSTQA